MSNTVASRYVRLMARSDALRIRLHDWLHHHWVCAFVLMGLPSAHG